MEEVPISKFKANCAALLEQVRKQPIRITRFGKPVAEIVSPSPTPQPGAWLDSMRGQIKILGDIVSPVIDESDIEALKD